MEWWIEIILVLNAIFVVGLLSIGILFVVRQSTASDLRYRLEDWFEEKFLPYLSEKLGIALLQLAQLILLIPIFLSLEEPSTLKWMCQTGSVVVLLPFSLYHTWSMFFGERKPYILMNAMDPSQKIDAWDPNQSGKYVLRRMSPSMDPQEYSVVGLLKILINFVSLGLLKNKTKRLPKKRVGIEMEVWKYGLTSKWTVVLLNPVHCLTAIILQALHPSTSIALFVVVLSYAQSLLLGLVIYQFEVRELDQHLINQEMVQIQKNAFEQWKRTRIQAEEQILKQQQQQQQQQLSYGQEKPQQGRNLSGNSSGVAANLMEDHQEDMADEVPAFGRVRRQTYGIGGADLSGGSHQQQHLMGGVKRRKKQNPFQRR